MAQEITVDNRQFGFSSIKIYRGPDECLGTGAYGAVFKAMCDELPCAAKLLHSALFQFNDPGMPSMMRRFQQECELMGRIRHPCIVQYLGTVQDPDSCRPILLMELMDESLTKFLERSTTLLAYYLQVNLSYDVALALAYLHSNGVIHRDLSSNNVLLTAGSRAKVADFGMLKLLEQNMRMTPLTKCPGTVAYMPPEALSDEPEYTDKLDCFSLGVLMIQMITRNFPKPTKAIVTVLDPKYPTGRVLIPVPEVERRKSDIDCIEPENCLRPIALDCIRDIEKDRPSAKDICQQLLHLKSREQYSESTQKGTQISSSTEMSEEVQRLRRECAEVRTLNSEKDKEIGGLRQELSELRALGKEKDSEIEDLKHQLCVQGQSQVIQRTSTWKLKWNEKSPVSVRRAMWRGAATSVGAMAFFNPGLTGIVYIYDSTSKDWLELPHCLHLGFTLVTIDNMVTAVGGNKELYTAGNALLSFSKGSWVQLYPAMSTKRYFPAAACISHYLVVAGGCGEDCQALATVEIMDIDTLQWSTSGSLPVCIPSALSMSASMTACGECVYLLGDDTNRVFQCSLKSLLQFSREHLRDESAIWKRITDLPVTRSTAVTLCGQLVSVGGQNGTGDADAVYCYDSARNKWREVGKLLSCKKLPLATTLPGDKLVVMHGNHDKTTVDTASATQYH